MITNRVRKAAAYTFATAALSASAVVAATGTAAAAEPSPVSTDRGEYAGCPYGAVCIYPDGSWNDGDPEHVYYEYGGHNLYDEYGEHRVFNNQYGEATVSYCTGWGGTDCGDSDDELPENAAQDLNLTPYNSIRLNR